MWPQVATIADRERVELQAKTDKKAAQYAEIERREAEREQEAERLTVARAAAEQDHAVQRAATARCHRRGAVLPSTDGTARSRWHWWFHLQFVVGGLLCDW